MQERVNSTRTTARLVRGARIGDREAFDGLFARIANRAQLYARLRLEGLGLGRCKPVEVIRDIYLTAYRAFPRVRYENEDAFLVWVCRIIENRIAVLARTLPPGKGETARVTPVP